LTWRGWRTSPRSTSRSASRAAARAVAGALTLPGERQTYRFTVTQKTFVSVDAHRPEGGASLLNLGWSLRGPFGSVASSGFETDDHNGRNADKVLALDPGTYELTVDGAGAFVGAYEFSVLDLGAATPDRARRYAGGCRARAFGRDRPLRLHGRGRRPVPAWRRPGAPACAGAWSTSGATS
jgi:hypothetical protein